MENNKTIVLLDKTEQPPEGMQAFNIDIPVEEDQLAFRLAAADTDAPLQDLIGPAQKLSNFIVADSIERLEKKGGSVSCKAGCGYCCRYLVPAVAPEAFVINDLIATIPAKEREVILQNTLAALEKIHAKQFTSAQPDDKSLQNLADWYKELEINCPFLKDNSCSIYDDRPLVCRELSTISDASTCRKDTEQTPEPLELPVSIAEVLIRTCDKVDKDAGSIILLPLLIPWCESNSQLAQKTWNAKELAVLFIDSIDESIKDKQG